MTHDTHDNTRYTRADGSDLFSPKVKLDQVVLPADQKRLILDTINNFEAFKECCKAKGLEDRLTYGTGTYALARSR